MSAGTSRMKCADDMPRWTMSPTRFCSLRRPTGVESLLQPKARHWVANHLHSLPKQLLGEFSDSDLRSSGMSWNELRAGLGLLLEIALIIGGSFVVWRSLGQVSVCICLVKS